MNNKFLERISTELSVIKRNIPSSLLILFVLSPIVLFILNSSNPFGISTKHSEINRQSCLKANGSRESSNRSIELSAVQNRTMEKHGEMCDMSVGKWVKDPNGPIYTNWTCPIMPEADNCVKHGKDPGYIYWRWKPDGCELPRFDPLLFLEHVRGKKMAFIGDSLARNQIESLLCLLSQVEEPEQIYADESNKHKTWYFPSHKFTLMVIWTEFLVEGQRNSDVYGSPGYELHLDKLNSNWTEKLPELDYMVLNGGNWFYRRIFMYENGNLLGCIFCGEKNVAKLKFKYGIRRTLRAALQYISNCKDCKEGLVAILRTYSPSHFEHGSWFSGGYCNRTQPLSIDDPMHTTTLEIRSIQLQEFQKVNKTTQGKKRFDLLDVTKAIMLRADGHRGGLWNWHSLSKGSDCLHWCLPGPIDMWNERLLALVLQRDSVVS